MPHLPQFRPSVFMSVHAPLHAVWPAGQVHTPLTQVAPVAHMLLHVPQFTALDMTSLHVPPQSAWPVAHRHALCQHV
jgi:hypothetical protein